MAENTQMLALGRKVGFRIFLIPGAGQQELKINLKEI